MNNDMPKDVPYIVYESEQVRNERNIKRLIVALIISIILIFTSNSFWLYAWMQYEYISEETVTIDGNEGNANYIGSNASGDIYNGKDYKENDQKP